MQHAARLKLQQSIDDARREAEELAALHSGDLIKEREARLRAEQALQDALRKAEESAALAQLKADEAAQAVKRAEVM